MQFATIALLLLILLLPGFIFQTAYNRGFWRWNSPNTTLTLPERIPSGIVFSGLLHPFGIVFCRLFGRPVDLASVMRHLLGQYGKDSAFFKESLESVTLNASNIFWYFAALYAFSALLGLGLHYLVRRYALDRKTTVLRFNNEWFYWLSGEATEFKELETVYSGVSPDGVILTAVVKLSGKDYIYRGLVEDWFFDKDGKLDRVFLSQVDRRDLAADRNPPSDEEFYAIEGDIFILRYSEMITVNIAYLLLSDVPESQIPGVADEGLVFVSR